MPNIPGPTSHSYFSQRLKLHYVDWGNSDAPPLLLIHGGRDHCRNWDWVAESLRANYHIIAPDLRGHGDSQWSTGGGYSFAEFVYDIAQLIHQTKMAPVTIIGHSLGGGISLRYAGVYPDNVKKVVAIEGLGRGPDKQRERTEMPIQPRLQNWIEEVRDMSARLPRRYKSLEEAFQRMQDANPHLRPDQARHLTTHGVNQNEDGTYSWKFDNYFRTFTPYGITVAETHELWSKITCPVLHMRGLDSWSTDPRQDERAACFKDAQYVEYENAGHWVHHDQLDGVLSAVQAFLAA